MLRQSGAPLQIRALMLTVRVSTPFNRTERERDFSGKMLSTRRASCLVADTAGLISYATAAGRSRLRAA